MKRDISLDILRCIAIISIVFVHIHPKSILLNQIRSFDVPLMVFLSGISYTLSNSVMGRTKLDYLSYCKKRFKRLILPSWIFLLIYYILFHIVYFLYSSNAHILWLEMLHNFTFFTGWYVWIIRVFFIISLCAPLVYGATLNTSNWKVIAAGFGILLVFEFIPLQREDSIIYYIGMVIPYISIFTIGLVVDKLSKKCLMFMAMFFAIIYIGYAIYYIQIMGSYQLTSIRKYPPKLYYMAYAISVSLLLYLIKNYIKIFCSQLKIITICEFIGSHTLWIYFWHIPIIRPVMIIQNDFLRFIVVIMIAVIITYYQVKIANKLIRKIESATIQKYLRTIFIG